jgi:hypothetical protein
MMDCILAMAVALLTIPAPADGETPRHDSAGVRSAWRYVQEIPLSRQRTGGLVDFVLPVAVFDGARADLGDLRLDDPAGKEVPYALRIRRTESRDEAIPAREFNRSKGPEGASEITLDLGETPGEHNAVEVQMPGANYRRHAMLEAGDDGTRWREMATKNLVHWSASHQALDDRQLSYPVSRFRYLRVRIERDPVVDQQPVEIAAVTVRRSVAMPGESLDIAARIGPREAVRADDGPGSAWSIELGGDGVPCERLTIDVAATNVEFVRNYVIEAGGPAGDADEPFRPVGRGLWRRRAGEKPVPLHADFSEVTASRLRLIVTDYHNPPLELRSASARMAAREVVLADPGPGATALALFYGNPRAELPRYDFARNLAATLDPPPARLTLAERRENPGYQPEPLPLTERWPWLIHVILGAISFGLGLIIVSLARTAVRLHDARPADDPAMP